MKKLIFTLLAVFALSYTIYATNKTEITLDNGVKIILTMQDGQLHGDYASWYKDGTKKSEGKFYHNNRVGTWKVWDPNGDLKAKRNYENNFITQIILPKTSKNKSKIDSLLPTRNKNGYFDYYNLIEDNVLYAVKNLSIILPENNPYLFENDKILEVFFENKDSEDYSTFKVFDSYEKKTFQLESIENCTIIAFKIMKEYIYENDRQIIEGREIWISPVIQNTKTKEIFSDNWFYFPNIRPDLAKIGISIPDCKVEIENISDLFFWDYNSEIIIRDNQELILNNKDIDDSLFTDKNMLTSYLDKNTLRLTERIEIEHKLWLEL